MNEEHSNFIKENYSIKRINAISSELGISRYKIRQIADKLKLQPFRGENVMYHEVFENITTHAAYFLGYLWADGCLTSSTIQIEISSTDACAISEVFYKVGNWRMTERQRYKKGKPFGNPMTCFALTDRKFASFLKSIDFPNKSVTSPSKLLKIIPEDLHVDFWHGFFDGDGSIHVGKSKRGKSDNLVTSLAFWGSFEQNWCDLLRFLDNHDITHNIHYYERSGATGASHKSSCLYLTNRADMNKLGNIFYQNGFTGLARKRNLFDLISAELLRVEKQRSELARKKSDIFNLYLNGASVVEIGKLTSLSTASVYSYIRAFRNQPPT